MDWIRAGLLLMFGVLHVIAGLLRTQYDVLHRLSLVFLGLSALFALLALVLSAGEFTPWGFPAVLCLVVGFATGLGWLFEKRIGSTP